MKIGDPDGKIDLSANPLPVLENLSAYNRAVEDLGNRKMPTMPFDTILKIAASVNADVYVAVKKLIDDFLEQKQK